MVKTIETNQFYPYEVIQEEGQKYLYNVITSGIFLMDNLSSDVLENKILEGTDNEYYEAIEYMKEKFIIRTKDNDTKLNDIYTKIAGTKKEMQPSSLVLMISQDCNLRCTYCYGTNGEYSHKGLMDYKTAKSAVDYFVKYAKGDKLNICFFGGEPLLNFSLIKEIIKYANEVGSKLNKTFTFSMTTNATLIDQMIEEFIIQNKIALTISIDGDRTIQNSNRYYANKKGSYDEVIKNTERLRKSNHVTARATITPQNLNILYNVDHLIDVGFNRVAWAPALNLLSNDDIEKLAQGQKEVVIKVGKCIETGDYIRAKKYLTIINMLSKINSDGLRTKGCGAGTNMMAVNIEGSIYPCHRFVGNEFMGIGNIYIDEPCQNNNFYTKVSLKEFEKCSSCIGRNICVGGCVNENFEANHDISIANDKHCNYYREVAREVIKLYIRLGTDEKERLFSR